MARILRCGATGRRRGLATAMVTALVAAALAACGGSTPATGTAQSPGGGQGVPAATQAAIDKAVAHIKELEQPITHWPGITPIAHPAELAGKRIMIVPLIAQVPILNGMAQGAQTALEHLGAKVTICDGKASPTSVDSCLKQAQAQKDFAVITNFVSFPMDPNGFTSLANSGTKVLIAGDSQVPGTTYPANVTFFDSSASLQAIAADEADAALASEGANANVIWLSQTDSTNTINQGDAGEAAFTQACPTCGFYRIKYATQDVDKLPSEVSAALVSHPNTNLIVLSVDTIGSQVMQGVQSAGFTSKVKLIGNGGDLDGLQRVKAGQTAHDFGASAVEKGYALAHALVQAVSGDKVSPAAAVTRDFTSNNIGDLKLTSDEYVTTHWYGNDSFKEEYYKVWAPPAQ